MHLQSKIIVRRFCWPWPRQVLSSLCKHVHVDASHLLRLIPFRRASRSKLLFSLSQEKVCSGILLMIHRTFFLLAVFASSTTPAWKLTRSRNHTRGVYSSGCPIVAGLILIHPCDSPLFRRVSTTNDDSVCIAYEKEKKNRPFCFSIHECSQVLSS
jgi:hypothetical protein